MRLGDVGDHGVQQRVITLHVAPVVGFRVEPVAQAEDGVGFPGGRRLERFQHLSSVGAAEADVAIVADMHGMERVNGAGDALPRLGRRGGVQLAQEEDDAGAGRAAGGPGHRTGAERGGLQLVAVLFQIPQQLGEEIVQREVAHRRGVVEAVQVQDFVAQSQQLPVAEIQIQLGVVFGERVLVAARRHVGQRHARLHAAFQTQVGVHVAGGPVIQHVDLAAAAAHAVDTPEALDEPHRVPVDVVVQHGVAVLQVLPLGDAVGGDQQIDLVRVGVRAAAGARGEVGEDGVEIVGAAGGAGVVAGHHRQIQAELGCQAGQVVVQVVRRVLEGGEHQQLAVGPAVLVEGRVRGLVPNDLFDLVQLAVARRRDRGNSAVRRPQGCAVAQ